MIEYAMRETRGGSGVGEGYLAVPEGGKGPGVLVLHAWWGLNDFFKGLCNRLAQEGFTALAPDLYGGKTAATVEEAEKLLQASDYRQKQARVIGAMDFLKDQPAVSAGGLGVIGFSMGAAWALLLSSMRPEVVDKVVVFYGSEPADFQAARAAYLGHFAEQDEWEPVEGVRQMETDLSRAGREVTFHYYPDVKHWFFEVDRPEYDPQAAELAWERTVEFLKR